MVFWVAIMVDKISKRQQKISMVNTSDFVNMIFRNVLYCILEAFRRYAHSSIHAIMVSAHEFP